MPIRSILEPSRAAHASLGGYLYQVYLGVERWLELKPGEVLRCEGDEDLDRLLLDGSGGVSEQVKVLAGTINVRDEVVLGTLRRFLVSHHALRTGEPPEERCFVFTSTAERRSQRLGPGVPVDVLADWHKAGSDDAVRAKTVQALRTLLPLPEPDRKQHPGEHRFWKALTAAIIWLDRQPERWGELIRSIQWDLEAADRPDLRVSLQARLRQLGAPDGFLDRLVGEILEASIDPNEKNRIRSREDLQKLLKRGKTELARWQKTPRGSHLGQVLGDLDLLARILYNKARRLPDDPSPAQLLSAPYEVIPFEEKGRREILEELAAWCADSRQEGLRLLYGEGGAGKTRLLIELCCQIGAQGWQAGFVEPTVRPEELVDLMEGEIPRLAVLDYAESHLEAVRFLVSRLARRTSGPKVRVVLLARRHEGWWEALEREGDADRDFLALAPPRPVEPLFADLEGRRQAFTATVRAFASRQGKVLPNRIPEPDLSRNGFGRALVLHMSAFLAVQGEAIGGSQDVVAGILEHELRYWAKLIREVSRDREVREELQDAMRRAAVCITLLGGTQDEPAARDIARLALPPEASPVRIRTLFGLLKQLYGAAAQEGRVLQGLEPDLLGEELVRQNLAREPELLSLALNLGQPAGLRQLLTMLTRLAQKEGSREQATDWLRQAFCEKLETLAEIALEVAVTQGDPIGVLLAPTLSQQAPAELARKVMQRCDQPDWQYSLALREVALAATERCLNEIRASGDSDSAETKGKLARVLSHLGSRRSDLGLREAALEATEEAVAIRRQLAAQRPDAFLPNLAWSLNKLGKTRSDLGQREAALEATEEAVGLYRRLADLRPGAFLPHLGMSLNDLGGMQSELGQREVALEVTQEAVGLYRRLAGQRPDAFLPHLAGSLGNLGTMLSDLGQREAALEVTQEAVDLYRRLADQRPDVFFPNLATGLNNLGNRRSAVGQREAALEATQEAVDLYRRLADQRPDAFLPDLGMSLNNLGLCRSAVGQQGAALEATLEAVDIRRRLANQHPDAFLPDLASSLNNLGKVRSTLGQWEEVLEATLEAIDIRRRLADQRPDAFLPDLATSLNNLGNTRSSLGQTEAALEATLEAVDIRRRLADQRPDAFLPDLATSLTNLGNRRSALGQREAALEATLEAVDIRRRLADQHPDAFLPDLATSLLTLGDRRSALGQTEAALEALLEGIRIFRPYFLRFPSAFGGLIGGLKKGFEQAALASEMATDREFELLGEIGQILASLQP